MNRETHQFVTLPIEHAALEQTFIGGGVYIGAAFNESASNYDTTHNTTDLRPTDGSPYSRDLLSEQSQPVADTTPGFEALDAEIARLRALGITPTVARPGAETIKTFKAPHTAGETVDLADVAPEDLLSNDTEAAKPQQETRAQTRLRKLGKVATDRFNSVKDSFIDDYHEGRGREGQRVVGTVGTPEGRATRRRETAKKLGRAAVQQGKRAAKAAAPHIDPRTAQGRRNIKRGATAAAALGRQARRRRSS